MIDLRQQIDKFLDGSPHAVVGASQDRKKFGNKILRCYLQHQRPVFAVNPNAKEVEGVPCFADLSKISEKLHGISIITPPEVSDDIIDQAIQLGVQHIWLQPGAESIQAIQRAKSGEFNLIPGTACLLVELGFKN